jgi:hypothetical protein
MSAFVSHSAVLDDQSPAMGASKPADAGSEALRAQFLAELLEQIQNADVDLTPKRNGWEISHRCPVPGHPDEKASCSSTVMIDSGKPKLLTKCFAGCSQDEVWNAMRSIATTASLRKGLELRQTPHKTSVDRAPKASAQLPTEDQLRDWVMALHETNLPKQLEEDRGWTIDAMRELELGFNGEWITIPHREPRTKELLTVERYKPYRVDLDGSDATFAPEQIKAKAWPGGERHLYRPPADLAAPEALLVLEGPPDAIAAYSRGLIAVAAPSADDWDDSYSMILQEAGVKKVLVIGDCDKAGREFAATKVAPSLSAHGIEIEIVDLNPSKDDGFDLTDWLQAQDCGAGDLLTQLRELAAPYIPFSVSPPPTPTGEVSPESHTGEVSPESHTGEVSPESHTGEVSQRERYEIGDADPIFSDLRKWLAGDLTLEFENELRLDRIPPQAFHRRRAAECVWAVMSLRMTQGRYDEPAGIAVSLLAWLMGDDPDSKDGQSRASYDLRALARDGVIRHASTKPARGKGCGLKCYQPAHADLEEIYRAHCEDAK